MICVIGQQRWSINGQQNKSSEIGQGGVKRVADKAHIISAFEPPQAAFFQVFLTVADDDRLHYYLISVRLSELNPL